MTVNLFTNLSWYLQFSSIRPFISFLVAGILTALSCNICSPEMSSGAATATAKINCNCASLPYQCSWHQSRSCPRLLAHLVISDTRRLLLFSRECQWLEVCCLCCLEIFHKHPFECDEPCSAGRGLPWLSTDPAKQRQKSEDAAWKRTVDKCALFLRRW